MENPKSMVSQEEFMICHNMRIAEMMEEDNKMHFSYDLEKTLT